MEYTTHLFQGIDFLTYLSRSVVPRFETEDSAETSFQTCVFHQVSVQFQKHFKTSVTTAGIWTKDNK